MGAICNKGGEEAPPTQTRPKKAGPQGSLGDTLDSHLRMDTVMNEQRRLTSAEKKEQADHFLTFKDKMQFKTVARFHEHYSKRKEIGSGAFGTVHIGMHRKTNLPCAIKTIKKESLMVHEVYEELNKSELEILESTVHPNITRIFELMEDSRNYYIVMEVITGGDLLKKIGRLQRFTEAQAIGVIHQLLLALNFMH